MEKFVIEGGYPLSGTIVPAGNKNAALPILASSLLTDEELVISNVPRIRDVDAMLALLEDLGVNALWRDDHELVLRADNVLSGTVDEELGSRIRASFLLAGPLLARFGEAHMLHPEATLSAGAASTRTSTRWSPSAPTSRRTAATTCGLRTVCAPAISSWTRQA